jgi:phenylalanyl-tRNA synthetase alpha chain
MPEKRFLRAALDVNSLSGIRKVSKLSKKEFNASMGLLKKKGFIDIDRDKVKVTSAGRKFYKDKKVEKLLSKIAKGVFLDEMDDKDTVKLMLKRGIFSSDEKVMRYISVTKKGQSLKSRVRRVKEVGVLTPRMLETRSWKKAEFRPYNLDAPAPKLKIGKKQPYRRFLDELKMKLVSLGFDQMHGPVVELSFFNCEALYMPQKHIAKSIHDIYYVKDPKYGKLGYAKGFVSDVAKTHKNGWKTGSKGWGYEFDEKTANRLILRSHGTALSARWLMRDDLRIPGKYFAMVRCYRPDVIDATHLAEFFQVEGIILGEGLNMRDLFGVLKMFAKDVAGVEKYRIKPGYFPFTEPSAELHGYKDGRWMEIGGSGIFRPELTKPLGIDIPVLAWGLGLDRQFMSAKGVSDIRELFSQDIDKLREAVL